MEFRRYLGTDDWEDYREHNTLPVGLLGPRGRFCIKGRFILKVGLEQG